MQGGFRKFLGCRPFHLVLGTQPLSQPLTSVSFNSSIGFADWPEIEVVSPSNHHVVEFRYHGLSIQQSFILSGLHANRLTDALHPFLLGSRAQIGPTRLRRGTSAKRVPEKYKLLFRQLADPLLALGHRQLQ